MNMILLVQKRASVFHDLAAFGTSFNVIAFYDKCSGLLESEEHMPNTFGFEYEVFSLLGPLKHIIYAFFQELACVVVADCKTIPLPLISCTLSSPVIIPQPHEAPPWNTAPSTWPSRSTQCDILPARSAS